MPSNLEHFTEAARRILSYAQGEAEFFEQNLIGTEHLLLGLLVEEGNIARRVLRHLGLEKRKVEAFVEQMPPTRGRESRTSFELSPHIKKALELAVGEAHQLGHRYIRPEHLLLGLVRLDAGTAITILQEFNISPEVVRQQTLLRMFQENPTQSNRSAFAGFESSEGAEILSVYTKAVPLGIPGRPIFLVYRREDSLDLIEQIIDQLEAHFGKGGIIRGGDFASIQLKEKEGIRALWESIIMRCSMQVVIIGPQWLTITAASGQPRLGDPTDFVRFVVKTALQLDMPVIPVFVQGALMPKLEELPQSLANLVYRKGIALRGEPDFKADVVKLIQGIEQALTR